MVSRDNHQTAYLHIATQVLYNSKSYYSLNTMNQISNTQTAIFGGGCFWCVDTVFRTLKGIVSVESGYMGGTTKNPTYEDVITGVTQHKEVVRVTYDPSTISYNNLLTVFFATHDPTSKDKQGADVGTQYGSFIFYTNHTQKDEAEKFIQHLNQTTKNGKPIATIVEPLETFYPAEQYHQDYYQKNKGAPYCQIVINPKLEKLRKEFSQLLKDKTDDHQKTEQEWKEQLSDEEYKILREKGTEIPFTGKYLNEKTKGTYSCAGCGNQLFSSDTKFDSKTGWPSFDKALPDAIKTKEDTSHGMHRTEVLCAQCNSHLGHLFDDGPTATRKRYCLNSVCLNLKKDSEA